MRIKNFVKGLLLAGTIAGTASAQNWDQVEIKTEHLRGNLHVLYGAGGNIGISAGPDGIFIIDDQFAPLTDRIKAAIAKISDAEIRFAINTHFHGDHTGGNENVGKTGTVIVAHDNVRVRLSKGAFIKAFNNKMEAQPGPALPVVTFNDEMSLHLNDDDARLIHVKNAHTDGDSFVYFKETNLIHMGDLFFAGSFPFIDVDNGGDIDGVIAASKKALSMSNEETIIIPGHGQVTDKAGLMKYLGVLQESRTIVAKLKGEGKSLEDIQKMKALAEVEKQVGSLRDGWTDRFIEFVYKSV
ncbi:MBL fold metallo-hydrolase [Kordiimonas laminariae]|uniref:MBL fold metallo-hydrolase n=1 Tax=Kordiimonas laminariae TaxID=2917717 RepID=UPI001FF1C564|nr:MBL fold metallo-hydrolase [Kordiimonas laminariae]